MKPSEDKSKFKSTILICLYQIFLLLLIFSMHKLIGWVICSVLYIIFSFFNIKYRPCEKITAIGTAISSVPAFLLSAVIFETLKITLLVSVPIHIALLAAEVLSAVFVICPYTSMLVKNGFERKITVKKFLKAFIPIFVLLFIFFVYIPGDSFITNKADFSFAFQTFIPRRLALTIAASVISAFAASFFVMPLLDAFSALVSGLVICVYAQYMFMNGNLAALDGTLVDWSKHTVYININAIIWIAILMAAVVIAVKKEKIWNKYISKISAVIGAVQALSLVISMFLAGRSLFEIETPYMSGKEQFTVSSKDNIIVFILDAEDNEYLKTIWETDPSAFDGFEDFTMYTNTCSVFDSTPTSISQMYTGMEFHVELSGKEWYETAWNSEKANEFFNRLHSANYTINGYSIDTDKVAHYKGKFDNYCEYVPDGEVGYTVNHDIISKNFNDLTLYRILPVLFKKYIAYDRISFEDALIVGDETIYDNNEFFSHMDLSLSESDKNYFITQHLYGVHLPCDDFIAESKNLLGIIRNYMEQLKQFGVYDNSSIIITADHGAHNSDNKFLIGTPAFMMKNKNQTGTKLELNNAPIYHEDFQATILQCAGLYDEQRDSETFGIPVSGWNEGDKRLREWYDRRYSRDCPEVYVMPFTSSTYNVYYGYAYTGDTDELQRVVNDEEYTVYPMTDYKG